MLPLPELKLYLEVKCNEKLPKCGRLFYAYIKNVLTFPTDRSVFVFVDSHKSAFS